jgi:hypothetical protein
MRERVLLVLLGLGVCFFALTLAERAGADSDLIARFDSTGEGNPAAWYSSLLLLGCALLAARAWLPLGLVLALMAVDELAQLHERVPGPVMDALEDLSGVSGTPVRLVAAAATIAVVVAALLAARPWYRSLPRPTRRLVAVSAGLFFAGALGLELVSRLFDRGHDGLDLWLGPVEELLEMSGAAVFAYALWPSAPAVSFVDSRVNDTGARPTTCP